MQGIHPKVKTPFIAIIRISFTSPPHVMQGFFKTMKFPQTKTKTNKGFVSLSSHCSSLIPSIFTTLGPKSDKAPIHSKEKFNLFSVHKLATWASSFRPQSVFSINIIFLQDHYLATRLAKTHSVIFLFDNIFLKPWRGINCLHNGDVLVPNLHFIFRALYGDRSNW